MKGTVRDNAGVIAPPPLIYAVTLVISLFLHQRIPLPLVPRKIKNSARQYTDCWSSRLRLPCSTQDEKSRNKCKSNPTNNSADTGRTVPLHPQPYLSGHDTALHGYCNSGKHPVAHSSIAWSAFCDDAWCD